MLATLSSGHHDASDWLLLIAVVLFVIALALALSTRAARPHWLTATTLQIAGFIALALALFVA